MEFTKNSDILPKILIRKEWSQTIWKLCKLSEFSKEIQSHFGHLIEFFVN